MLPPYAARLAALVDDGSGQDLLARAEDLCALCLEVTGAGGVALSVAGGELQPESSTVCGTDALSMRLEEMQLGLAEGPIGDALHSEFPVLAADLGDASRSRWLWFAPAAVEAGACAVFVFPVCVGERCAGALSLYRRSNGDLTVEEFDDLAAVVDAASVILRPGHADAGEQPGSWTVADGTGFQPVIPQAVGVIMADLRVDADDALALMRGHAFAADQSIREVAHEIVAGRLRLGDDSA